MERELRLSGLPVKKVMSPPGLKFSLLLVTVEKGYSGIAEQVVSVPSFLEKRRILFLRNGGR